MDKLRNMEVFMAVVEDGSFAQAARRLDISAVMVGKHVQQLEAHLGARLLQRTTRRHSLTEVGRSFYEDSRQVFEQDRKSTRLNSSHLVISYAVFCLKKKHESR